MCVLGQRGGLLRAGAVVCYFAHMGSDMCHAFNPFCGKSAAVCSDLHDLKENWRKVRLVCALKTAQKTIRPRY